MKKYIDIIGKKVYYIGVERVKTKIIMKWEEDMLEIDRFEKILDELEKKGRLSYQELDSILKVSPSTIRRDIEKMYKNNLLIKIKGGIAQLQKLNFDPKITDRFNKNVEGKKEIAEKAFKRIKKGDFIYLDAGTTVFYLIEKLKDTEVTVITNGTMHIDELLKNNIRTIIAGGEIKALTGAVVGIETVEFLDKYQFDKCFLGTNGISIKAGFTTPEVNEAMVKKKVLEISEEKYILADEDKFDKISNIKFSSLGNCKIITTNKAIKENNRYKKYFY